MMIESKMIEISVFIIPKTAVGSSVKPTIVNITIKDFYKIYNTDSTLCKVSSCTGSLSSCPYYYPNSIVTSTENRDLYDRWLTTLILAIIIDIFCLGLSVFGFLLFKSSKGDSGGEKTVPIN